MRWSVYRQRLTKDDRASGHEATGFIFIIVIGANILTLGFDYLRLSRRLLAAVADAEFGRLVI